MTDQKPELKPCYIGGCTTLEEAQLIRTALDDSQMAIGEERVAVKMNDAEKQILRKILWHYRTHHTRTSSITVEELEAMKDKPMGTSTAQRECYIAALQAVIEKLESKDGG